MAGMLQILTYLLGFYLIMKGVEILQIGLTSARANRTGPIILGVVALAACLLMAIVFISMQDIQAGSLSNAMPSMPRY